LGMLAYFILATKHFLKKYILFQNINKEIKKLINAKRVKIFQD